MAIVGGTMWIIGHFLMLLTCSLSAPAPPQVEGLNGLDMPGLLRLRLPARRCHACQWQSFAEMLVPRGSCWDSIYIAYVTFGNILAFLELLE